MTQQANSLNLLRINSSIRGTNSVSRDLADGVVSALEDRHGSLDIVTRDLGQGVPLIDGAWVGANFTDPAQRTNSHREVLSFSDTLIDELRDADVLVIAAPIYNFSVAAGLKAYIDLISRARETFRYSEEGPVGLLTGKKAYIVVSSGGTEVGSDIDFATGYLRHVLGFVGIDDVTFIAADRLALGADESLAAARAEIAKIAAREESVAA